MECTLLIAALGLLAFGSGVERGSMHPWLRRVTVALLCAMVISDVYYGAQRTRVYTIGPNKFFQWKDNRELISTGFLKDMRVGSAMIAVQREVVEAKNSNPGPFFFGPRIDYNYAVLGLPSPAHFPAWWHPGTAFGMDQMSRILHDWQQDRFPTLIFLKNDYTYYPPAFRTLIQQNYLRDDRFPDITVYHRRAAP